MPRGPRSKREDDLLARPPEARRLVLARLRAGLTQAEAAHAVGITEVWVWAIEHGERPSAALLQCLLDLYGDD